MLAEVRTGELFGVHPTESAHGSGMVYLKRFGFTGKAEGINTFAHREEVGETASHTPWIFSLQ